MKQQIIIYLALILCGTLAMAQPPAPPATPIDGGLSLLLAAGGAFGIKKILDRKSSSQ